MISIGKRWALRRLSDKNGFFKMASLDQRPPIEEPIAQALPATEELNQEIVKFKRLLIDSFQEKSTAMLLDPSFAVAGCLDRLDPKKGLFVSLEDPYSRKTSQGASLTTPIQNWSVSKIKRLGADAVKLLIWYRPDGDKITNQHQEDLVEHIGLACVKYDIPFVLELLAYPPHHYQENAETKARCVLQSVEEFAQLKYHVDVFMVESPLAASHVPGIGNPGWEVAQYQFDKMADLAGRPWMMLSMGADMAEFHKIMTHAYKAGCSGYLAGRAYWLNTLSYYPNWKKMRDDLQGEAQNRIRALNQLTDEMAKPWFSHFGYEPLQDEIMSLDKDFCQTYAEI